MNNSVLARRTVEKCIGRQLFNPQIIGVGYPAVKLYEDINEVVHHINRDQSDNRPENLYVFRHNGKHADYHNKIRIWSFGLCGKTWIKKFVYLRTFPDLKSNLSHLKDLNDRDMVLSEYVEKNM